MINNKTKIKILGAGPTGSMLAIALSRAGSQIEIIDKKNSMDISNRSRAYAITNSTRNLLETIELWDKVLPYLTSFNRLYLEDRVLNKHITFDPNDFCVINPQRKDIGWIIDHKSLMSVLFENLNSCSNIVTSFGAEIDNQTINDDFLIAADGPNSPTRSKFGIGSFQYSYSQCCLTAKILLRGATPHTAYELFQSEGPLALLPMGSDLFQLVWSAPAYICKKRLELSNSLFLDKLASFLPNGLEPDSLVDQPAVFPLQLSIATQFYKGKIILVGESAHRCHPVGGQGLNLCWRDVYQFMFIIDKLNRNKIKSSSVGLIYTKKRILDVLSVSFFTHLLIKLFSNKNPISLILRIIILGILDKFKILRMFSLRFMSYGLM